MLCEIKSENFLGEAIEFNFNKNNNSEKSISDNNYVEPNSKSCEDSNHDCLFNEKIYNEASYDYEELEKENSNDGMNAYITRDIFNELINGNREVLNNLLNKINRDESKKSENNLLNKKRKSTSKKRKKNKWKS